MTSTGIEINQSPRSDPRERIIVALDVDDTSAADRLVEQLAGRTGAFKVGLQLFTNAGPGYVRELSGRGLNVFLDLKYHDIPNTVAGAVVEAAKLGVWMVNVHALGGGEMMRRAAAELREHCERTGQRAPILIGVTVLTSSDDAALREVGIGARAEDEVLTLAALARRSGLDGVVASPREAAAIRSTISDGDLVIVTPGVRPPSSASDDQKRVSTPAEAIRSGADYLVIGRPITASNDPAAALEAIVGDLGELSK
ncbi:MAG: orotidine-5'-phosphate decarboxylase [Pyrinomonadaceae bacterium]